MTVTQRYLFIVNLRIQGTLLIRQLEKQKNYSYFIEQFQLSFTAYSYLFIWSGYIISYEPSSLYYVLLFEIWFCFQVYIYIIYLKLI